MESLFEHADQRVEVAVLLITNVIAESGGAFAVEDQEFGKSGGATDGLAVAGDCLFGLYDGDVLAHARPEPTLNDLFIRLQNIPAKIETCVKKSFRVAVGRVHILNESEQSRTVEVDEYRFHIFPGGIC